MKRRSVRLCRFAVKALCAAAASACGGHAWGAVTLTQNSNTNWTISNGQITAVFDPSAEDITSVQLAGSSANLLSELDEEFAGTPFGGGTQTFNSQVGPNNSYVDVWTTVASAGTAQNSNGTYVNPITYAFHYLIYANDPTIYCYETLNHSATDPATSVGQGQFLFRSNPSLFPNLYQINTGPNQLGTAGAVTTLNVPSTYSNWSTVSAQAGRSVQNATTDLTGSSIPGDNGTNFFTKYDYSIYTQFFQAETMYGGNYAVTEVDPSTDSLTGGPTKQELAWTDPGILNMEFLSDHYGIDGSGSGTYPGYGYYPAQGVATSKLYGPYGFTISSTTGTTAAAINQSVINSIPTQHAEFNTDTELAASGYVNTTTRGQVQITASNSAGWSSNTSNNTVVLSEPGVNFQESTQGYQYWGQLSQSGTVTISNVVPGTYRMSIYQLGQWGETRVDGVQVNGNTISIPQNLTFTPENFGTAPPIWTIGTPNRSSNEFMNGHNASGADQRQYYGAYNYWAEESALGNNGFVSYNATATTTINGVHEAATNNPNAWIANQWVTFNPGEYDSVNGTSDFYSSTNNPNYNTSSPTNPNGAPAYVVAAPGGAAYYTGAAWQVHFTTTSAQNAQGQYVVLSVALVAQDASLVLSLNGHSETWSYNNFSPDDPMVRSGDAGFYQWAAFQFPTTDLSAVGTDNVFTFGLSNHSDGVMYDAIRMEITNTSANPSTTGWHDYTYINGSTQTAQNDAMASTASNSFSGSSQWALTTGGSWSAGASWNNYIIPGSAGDVATFGNIITAASTITLDGNRTVGSLVFNSSSASYTIAAGTGGTLTLNQSGGTATVTDLAGSHTISAPVNLASNTQITVTSAANTLTISGAISGTGNLLIAGAGTVRLTGTNSYAGTTNVSAGTLISSVSGALPSGTKTTVALGATFVSDSQNTITNLGSLNLNGNLIVHGGNLSTLAHQAGEGYNSGAWNGTSNTYGIPITSSLAAGDTTHLHALGVIQNDNGAGTGTALYTMFESQPVSDSDMLMKYTYYGDTNLDGKIDGSDYSRLDNGYLSHSTLTGWFNGDFNYDGVIDGSDYTLIDNAYNTQGAQLTAEVASPAAIATDQIAGTSAVPEPTTATLLSLTAIGQLRRRRRSVQN